MKARASFPVKLEVAAKRLGVDPKTLRRAIHRGDIRAVKFPGMRGKWIYPEDLRAASVAVEARGW